MDETFVIEDIFLTLVNHRPRSVVSSNFTAHEWHELILVNHGRYHSETNVDSFVLESGQVIFYGAGTPHRSSALDGSRLQLWVLGWKGWHPPWPSAFTIMDHCQRILLALSWAHDRRDAHHLLMESLVRSCLGEIEAVRKQRLAPSDPIHRVKNLLEQMIYREVSLGELARSVNMTAPHLCRSFFKVFSETPMAYLCRRRLETGLILHRDGQVPVKEIAARLGYASPASLHRAMRRFGISFHQDDA
ncbi:hypothetical protein LBMAG53_33870 [Planctomycetota bacterium]|nr:hypothetical protein LBMAG53_33870 [Planctomycetota bacterium]